MTSSENTALTDAYPENPRDQNINLFVESDHIFPPFTGSPQRRRFHVALAAVLRRLPEDVFDFVEENIGFVIDDISAFAINVPFERALPVGKAKKVTLRIDQIVIFQSAFKLSDIALIALIAHEIAHSMTVRNDHVENERASDALVAEWGFHEELMKLNADKEELFHS